MINPTFILIVALPLMGTAAADEIAPFDHYRAAVEAACLTADCAVDWRFWSEVGIPEEGPWRVFDGSESILRGIETNLLNDVHSKIGGAWDHFIPSDVHGTTIWSTGITDKSDRPEYLMSQWILAKRDYFREIADFDPTKTHRELLFGDEKP